MVALLGASSAKVEDLIVASERLAPGLAELIEASIAPLAERARLERQQEL